MCRALSCFLPASSSQAGRHMCEYTCVWARRAELFLHACHLPSGCRRHHLLLWFECGMPLTGSPFWMFNHQLMVLFWKVVEQLGTKDLVGGEWGSGSLQRRHVERFIACFISCPTSDSSSTEKQTRGYSATPHAHHLCPKAACLSPGLPTTLTYPQKVSCLEWSTGSPNVGWLWGQVR